MSEDEHHRSLGVLRFKFINILSKNRTCQHLNTRYHWDLVFIARRLAEIIQGVSADEEEKMKMSPVILHMQCLGTRAEKMNGAGKEE